MRDFDNRACRLLADLFADLGGKRRKICIGIAYLVDSIESVLSWQSGGRGFDPRQLLELAGADRVINPFPGEAPSIGQHADPIVDGQPFAFHCLYVIFECEPQGTPDPRDFNFDPGLIGHDCLLLAIVLLRFRGSGPAIAVAFGKEKAAKEDACDRFHLPREPGSGPPLAALELVDVRLRDPKNLGQLPFGFAGSFEVLPEVFVFHSKVKYR
jgi:hypothetical protein